MICPRCGIINSDERPACTRCAGPLMAPPRENDLPLPPVVPLTRRAELMMSARAQANPAARAQQVEVNTPDEAGIYLLAAERNTGQPPPPGAHRDAEPARADGGQRPDRLVPRLSPAP